MKIIEFHARIMKIMNILEFHAKNMKIMNTVEFNVRIMKKKKKCRNPYENHANSENPRIPNDNQ